jgi:Cdc6-like AAA superfamily ATPase
MSCAISQATQPNNLLANQIKNSSISSDMLKAIKTLGSFTLNMSIKPVLPLIPLLTVLYYDKITDAIEKSLPQTLKNINVPMSNDFKESLNEISNKMKETSPELRKAVQKTIEVIIENLPEPIKVSADFVKNSPHIGVPAALFWLTKATSVVFPQVKAFKIANDIINGLLVFGVPIMGMYFITEPLQSIANSIASMSPKEIEEASKQAAKIKLKAEGYEPLEAKIWNDKEIEEYTNKPLHYPTAVTDKIEAFKTILKAPKTGKSDLQAFCFYGPPGTGKTSIMNKLSATVTKTVNERDGTTHHYTINGKDLKQFDWKLDQLTKFVNGEELDDFYKLDKKNTFMGFNVGIGLSSGNTKFITDRDAICIQIDEANQMGSENLAKLQSTITELENSGQKVVIFMTTNYLEQIPEAMQRRIQPLEIGFPDKKQKELILKENIEKLTIEGQKVFKDAKDAQILTDKLKTAFSEAKGLETKGIMGDHIVKSLHQAIQLSIASKGNNNYKQLINNNVDMIAKKFKENIQECVKNLPKDKQDK